MLSGDFHGPPEVCRGFAACRSSRAQHDHASHAVELGGKSDVLAIRKGVEGLGDTSLGVAVSPRARTSPAKCGHVASSRGFTLKPAMVARRVEAMVSEAILDIHVQHTDIAALTTYLTTLQPMATGIGTRGADGFAVMRA